MLAVDATCLSASIRRRAVRWSHSLLLAALVLVIPARAAACEGRRSIPAETVEPSVDVEKVAIIIQDLNQGTCWYTDWADVNERHPPWSTFKIPHFLIALESGAVDSADAIFRWDPVRRPAQSYWPTAWKQDQSLKSAFVVSAAWPFQDLVPTIGPSAYRLWLARFRFGNGVVPPDRDDFWLGGALTISPIEQVNFLACVVRDGCGTSDRSLRALEAAAIQDRSAGHSMYAKTGSGPIAPRDFSGPFEGWYVGYIRGAQGHGTVVFATYIRSRSYESLRTYRESATRRALDRLGFWPPSAELSTTIR